MVLLAHRFAPSLQRCARCFFSEFHRLDYTVVNYTVLSQDVTIARNRIHAAVDRIEFVMCVFGLCSRTADQSTDANMHKAIQAHRNSTRRFCAILFVCISDRRLSGSFVSVSSMEFIRCDLLRWTVRASKKGECLYWMREFEHTEYVDADAAANRLIFFLFSWDDRRRKKIIEERTRKKNKRSANQHQLEMENANECKVCGRSIRNDGWCCCCFFRLI